MLSFRNMSQDDTDEHCYVLYKSVRNIPNRTCKEKQGGEGLFWSISWMNPKTDGLEVECVLDDAMNFVQRLSLVLQTCQFVSDSSISSYWFKSE